MIECNSGLPDKKPTPRCKLAGLTVSPKTKDLLRAAPAELDLHALNDLTSCRSTIEKCS
jgi:hypothetical protein